MVKMISATLLFLLCVCGLIWFIISNPKMVFPYHFFEPKTKTQLKVRHVWHDNQGKRNCVIAMVNADAKPCSFFTAEQINQFPLVYSRPSLEVLAGEFK